MTNGFPAVEILFRITSAGMPINNPVLGDVRLEEDGQERVPELITCADTNVALPVAVMLIFDRSGSMAGNPLTDAKDAGVSFIQKLRSDDEAAIIAFESTVRLLAPFTTDKLRLTQAIRSIMVGDKTNLWGACVFAVGETAVRTRRRAIVLLTDGYNSSEFSTYTVDSVALHARREGIPFYTIGLGEAVDSVSLQNLARETGGRYFYSPTSANLQEIYDEIAHLIGSRGWCRLRYRSSLPCLDGQLHDIRLEVNANGMYGAAEKQYRAPFDEVTLTPVGMALGSDIVIDPDGPASLPLILQSLPPGPAPRSLEFNLECDTTLVLLRNVTPTSITNGFTADIRPISTGYHLHVEGNTGIISAGTILRFECVAADPSRYATVKTTIRMRDIVMKNSCAAAGETSALLTVSGRCERPVRQEGDQVMKAGELRQNIPNPVRWGSGGDALTLIGFTTRRSGPVLLSVYNAAGAEVAILHEGFLEAGNYSLPFRMRGLASGSYWYKLTSPGFTAVKRFLILK